MQSLLRAKLRSGERERANSVFSRKHRADSSELLIFLIKDADMDGTIFGRLLFIERERKRGGIGATELFKTSSILKRRREGLLSRGEESESEEFGNIFPAGIIENEVFIVL